MNCIVAVGAAALLLAAAGAPDARAEGEFRFGGYGSAEVRIFPQDPALSFQDDEIAQPSFAGELELEYHWNDGDDRVNFVPFGRYDLYDGNRSHFDIRRANWLHREDSWDVVIGVDRIFWGVAESRHLVDIINQMDGVEDLDEEDRLGQPMVNFNAGGDWGRGSLFILPGVRERTFPETTARLSGGVTIDEDATYYESSLGQADVGVAARYENTFDAWDAGISYFHGTSREPTLQPRITAGGISLVPYYELIDQVSVDAQGAYGPLLLKLEALGRFGHGDPFFAMVGGFEYTLFDVGESGIDVGVLGEYLYDGRDPTAPATAFDNDVFVGTRVTFNDTGDTNILAGGIIDVDDQTTFISVETSTRVYDGLRLAVEARVTANEDTSDPLYVIRNDDFVQVKLSQYF